MGGPEIETVHICTAEVTALKLRITEEGSLEVGPTEVDTPERSDLPFVPCAEMAILKDSPLERRVRDAEIPRPPIFASRISESTVLDARVHKPKIGQHATREVDPLPLAGAHLSKFRHLLHGKATGTHARKRPRSATDPYTPKIQPSVMPRQRQRIKLAVRIQQSRQCPAGKLLTFRCQPPINHLLTPRHPSPAPFFDPLPADSDAAGACVAIVRFFAATSAPTRRKPGATDAGVFTGAVQRWATSRAGLKPRRGPAPPTTRLPSPTGGRHRRITPDAGVATEDNS